MTDALLDALCLIPCICRTRDDTERQWGPRAPVALIYAQIGRALIDHAEALDDPTHAYLLGVLSAALRRTEPKHLVRQPLISTAIARGEQRLASDHRLLCLLRSL
ncbi:hypothetical protein Y882_06950 [Dyella japonica DSM 16301]|uniref:Uncharacterized protein n=1 Tax=Dyella japonica DSM 16301 TaxID=1440762 RepID=A0A0G9H4T9_9GAMM|nr:hypothetical protein Y882_06950 [Dyella japonica DSM 16301]